MVIGRVKKKCTSYGGGSIEKQRKRKKRKKERAQLVWLRECPYHEIYYQYNGDNYPIHLKRRQLFTKYPSRNTIHMVHFVFPSIVFIDNLLTVKRYSFNQRGKMSTQKVDIKATHSQGSHSSPAINPFLIVIKWYRCAYVRMPFTWWFMHLLLSFFGRCRWRRKKKRNDNELCQWSGKDVIMKTRRRNIILRHIHKIIREKIQLVKRKENGSHLRASCQIQRSEKVTRRYSCSNWIFKNYTTNVYGTWMFSLAREKNM